MKFLVDAQLPRQMTKWFIAAGHDAIHTLELPDANETPDSEIIERTEQDDCIVITKDFDFVDSHQVNRRPAKLLFISTGNIRNRELEALMVPLIPEIIREFDTHAFLELGLDGLILRD